MRHRGMAGLGVVICLLLVSLLWSGCGGGGGPIASRDRHLEQQMGTEYLLQQAGFKKIQVNQTMPKAEALLSALPKRTVTTYERDGQKLYAYGDKNTRTLYVGDILAFQRYLALAQGRQVCEQRVGGAETATFWNCMDEYRQGGGRLPGK
jgi:hypothetical protein